MGNFGAGRSCPDLQLKEEGLYKGSIKAAMVIARVYSYALNLAVELLRREEKVQAGRNSNHA